MRKIERDLPWTNRHGNKDKMENCKIASRCSKQKREKKTTRIRQTAQLNGDSCTYYVYRLEKVTFFCFVSSSLSLSLYLKWNHTLDGRASFPSVFSLILFFCCVLQIRKVIWCSWNWTTSKGIFENGCWTVMWTQPTEELKPTALRYHERGWHTIIIGSKSLHDSVWMTMYGVYGAFSMEVYDMYVYLYAEF